MRKILGFSVWEHEFRRPRPLRAVSAGAALLLSLGVVPVEAATHSNLSGSEAVTDNDSTVTLENTADSVYQGAFSSGGTVTKTGSGTLTVSGGATFSSAGPVNIQEGVLCFGDRTPNHSGTLTMNIASGAALEFNMTAGDTYTANNSLLTANNQKVIFSGDGTLKVTGGAKLYQQSKVVTGASVTYALSKNAVIDIENGTFVNGGWQNVNTDQNYATLNIGENGAFDVWNGKAFQVGKLTGSGTVAKGYSGTTSLIIGNGTTADDSAIFAGTMQQTQLTLEKIGDGTQEMTGNVSLDRLLVNDGTLVFSGTSAFSAANGVTIADGAVLKFTDRTTNHSGTLTMNIASGGVLEFNMTTGDTYTASNSLLNVNDQKITFSGDGTLKVTGGAKLYQQSKALTGSSITYALSKDAVIDIENGTLVNGGWQNVNTDENYATLNIGENGAFDVWNGKAFKVGKLTGSGKIAKGYAGNTTLILGNGTTADDQAVFTGNIQHEELSIEKIGGGKQTIGGNLTLNGLKVTEGELEVNGTFDLNGEVVVNSHLNLNGEYGKTSGYFDGTVTGTGTITLNGGKVDEAIFINGNAAGFTGTLVSESGYVSLDETNGRKLSDSGLTLAGGIVHNEQNSPVIASPVFLKEGTTSGLMCGWGNTTMENTRFVTISGKISGAGALQIFADSGTNVLANTNDYSGGTIIGGAASGTTNKRTFLRLDAPNALGTGPVSFGQNDAELNINGNAQTFGGLSNGTFTGTKILNTGEAAALTFAPASGDHVYSGTLPSNLTDVTKTGAGSQTLTANLTLDSLTVSEGELVLQGTSTLRDSVHVDGQLRLDSGTSRSAYLNGTVTGTGTITLNGGKVDEAIFINGNAAGFTGTLVSESGYVSLDETNGRKLSDSGLTLAGGIVHNEQNSPVIASPVFLKEGTTSGLMCGWGNTTMENTRFVTISGKISGAGALQIFADSGTNVLANTNDYSGGTIIGGAASGTTNKRTFLRLDAPNALGTGPVSFGQNDAEMNINGNAQTFGGLSNGTFTGTKIMNTGEAAALTFAPASGEYVYSGALPSNLTDVTKTGAGSQTLTNLHASGTTTVEQGTLTLAGNSMLNDVVMKGGTLAEASDSQIALADGSTVSIVPAEEFVQLPGLDFTNSTLQLTITSDALYSQFNMTEVPTFDENAGFIDVAFTEGMEFSDAGYLVAEMIGDLNGSQDFNDWLLETEREDWNLAWVSGKGLMLTALGAAGGGESAAVPEPAAFMLLLLGMGILGLRSIRFKK